MKTLIYRLFEGGVCVQESKAVPPTIEEHLNSWAEYKSLAFVGTLDIDGHRTMLFDATDTRGETTTFGLHYVTEAEEAE